MASEPVRDECMHLKAHKWPAYSTVTHQTQPCASSHADPVHTETKLCLICSGELVALLQKLELHGP